MRIGKEGGREGGRKKGGEIGDMKKRRERGGKEEQRRKGILTCSMENSFPATSATLAMVSAWFCSPISRHFENVKEDFG